jgi:hypothetical protein
MSKSDKVPSFLCSSYCFNNVLLFPNQTLLNEYKPSKNIYAIMGKRLRLSLLSLNVCLCFLCALLCACVYVSRFAGGHPCDEPKFFYLLSSDLLTSLANNY